MSAWASEHRLVLGQCAVESKSNEITAIPVLLEQLSLTGCIVSIDAMGTHSVIAQQIHQQQADYILALKDNQPTPSKQAQQWFEQFQAGDSEGVDYTQHQQCEAGHHRIESRTVFQFPVCQVFTAVQCRYVGLAKAHLQHVLSALALNVLRAVAWLNGVPLARTRQSRLARLAPSPT